MRSWEFEVGDCVDHITGGMAAIVLDRAKTAAGKENYTVRLIDDRDERRDRLLRREFVARVLVGDKQCQPCPFMKSGRCCR